jgi:hypothetical protein
VDFRRGGIQLAAAPSSGHLYARCLHIEEEATLEGEHNTVRYSELFEPKLLKILALGIFIAVFVKKRNAAILCTRSLACRHRPNGR